MDQIDHKEAQEMDHDHKEIISTEEVHELEQNLPKATCFGGLAPVVKYQGFWFTTSQSSPNILKNAISVQRHFRARETDIFIASMPKTGNTWLKALLFAVVTRQSESPRSTQDVNVNINNNSMLTKKHPHELVYHLENDIYGKGLDYPHPHQLDELPSPRLFHTHLSYESLPESIKVLGCRILYITRNPLDVFVSGFHFFKNAIKAMRGEEYAKRMMPNMDDYFEECYEGRVIFGPFFDHVLQYWKQSLEQPNKVLFIKYEDLCDDPVSQLKRLAEFVGFPFSLQEEKEGVIQRIISVCSFDNMKDLEVNKTGVINKYFEKKSYFRKGKVGDWANYFTPCMAERMNKLMQEKLDGSGLSFQPY